MANSKVSLKIILLFLLTFGWEEVWGQIVYIENISGGYITFRFEESVRKLPNTAAVYSVTLDWQVDVTLSDYTETYNDILLAHNDFYQNSYIYGNPRMSVPLAELYSTFCNIRGFVGDPYNDAAQFYFSITLNVKYNTGYSSDNCYDEATYNFDLDYYGYVIPPYVIVSGDVNFGNVNVGSSLQKNIRLSSTGPLLILSSFYMTNTNMGFTFPQQTTTGLTSPARYINSQYGYAYEYIDIPITFTPTTNGSKSTTLVYTVDNFDNIPTKTNSIEFTGNGVGPVVSVSHTSLAFGNIEINSNSQQNIKITNSGNAALNISSFAISGTGFAFTATQNSRNINANAYYDLPVKFTPTTAGQNYTGTVTLTHNSNNVANSKTTINLSGAGASRIISLSPVEINFGEVNIGSNLQKSVRITNSGNVALNISSFVISGTGFAFTATQNSRNINANTYYDLPIKFTPTSTTYHTGTVTLTHNSTNVGATSIINLIGGKEKPITTILIPKLQIILGDK